MTLKGWAGCPKPAKNTSENFMKNKNFYQNRAKKPCVFVSEIEKITKKYIKKSKRGVKNYVKKL